MNVTLSTGGVARVWEFPQNHLGSWGGQINYRTYTGLSKQDVVAQMENDPRNDPHSPYRVTQELTEVRTVLSRAITAASTLRTRDYASGDFEHDEILAALDETVERLQRWAKPGHKSRGQRNAEFDAQIRAKRG